MKHTFSLLSTLFILFNLVSCNNDENEAPFCNIIIRHYECRFTVSDKAGNDLVKRLDYESQAKKDSLHLAKNYLFGWRENFRDNSLYIDTSSEPYAIYFPTIGLFSNNEETLSRTSGTYDIQWAQLFGYNDIIEMKVQWYPQLTGVIPGQVSFPGKSYSYTYDKAKNVTHIMVDR